MLKQKDKNIFIICVLVIWFFIAFFGSYFLRKDLYNFIDRIPIFILGIYLWYLNDSKMDINYNTYSITVLIIVFILGVFTVLLTKHYEVYLLLPISECFLPNLLLTISICSLVPLLFETIKHKNLILNFFTFFGKMSLELYCVQEWLGLQIIPVFKELLPNNNLLINILYFAIVTLASYLMFNINKKIWNVANKHN